MLLIAAAVLLPMAPVHADTIRHRDAQRDMSRRLYDTASRAPSAAVGDIMRVSIKHTATRVKVAARFREIKRSGTFNFGVLMQTSEAPVVEAILTGSGGADLTNISGLIMPCADLRQKRNFARDTMMLSIPRSCLGNPLWVKVNPYGRRYVLSGPNKGIYTDLALRNGGVDGKATRRLFVN